MCQIILLKKPKKFLDKLSSKEAKKFIDTILDLKYFPKKGDIKKLRGKFKGSFRLRFRGWRVLFVRDDKDKKMVIYLIGKRGDVY